MESTTTVAHDIIQLSTLSIIYSCICNNIATLRSQRKTFCKPVNTHHQGSITVWLISSLTGLDLTKEKKLSVCSKCVKYKLVQLETSCTVILHPKVIIAASQIIERLNKSQIIFLLYLWYVKHKGVPLGRPLGQLSSSLSTQHLWQVYTYKHLGLLSSTLLTWCTFFQTSKSMSSFCLNLPNCRSSEQELLTSDMMLKMFSTFLI